MTQENNYLEIDSGGGAPIRAWVKGVMFEDQAAQQLRNAAQLPFIFRWIAAMPDVHMGIGATVGSVIPTKGAIIPAAVGVDIGCGMAAVRTNIMASELPDSLGAMRAEIEATVPHGPTDHGRRNDTGAWTREPPAAVGAAWDRLKDGYAEILEQHPKAGHPRALGHLGTLGTGNHFIELCLDEEDRLWIMLHSGSRGPGNKLGTYFIELAKKEMRRWFVNLIVAAAPNRRPFRPANRWQMPGCVSAAGRDPTPNRLKSLTPLAYLPSWRGLDRRRLGPRRAMILNAGSNR
jgi:tRNA-splicing ligase RtcB (3'-phosphate/5'-hydroxy nucleic acid ligase)